MRTVVLPNVFARYPRDWHLSPGIDTGGFVFFSGITGTRPDQSLSADPEQQFREAFEFLGQHLGAAGLDYEHIVEMTTYHVGLRDHLESFTKVKDLFIHEPYPAWSAIGVSDLITPGTLVEIRVIAQRPVGSEEEPV